MSVLNKDLFTVGPLRITVLLVILALVAWFVILPRIKR